MGEALSRLYAVGLAVKERKNSHSFVVIERTIAEYCCLPTRAGSLYSRYSPGHF